MLLHAKRFVISGICWEMDISRGICFYFLLGMRHWEILTCLRMDCIQISMSTLRRRLKLLGLFRRKAQSDLLEVALFLHEQLNQYGILHGYRFMHLKCIQAGLVVTQSTVRALLKILDPNGVHKNILLTYPPSHRQHVRGKQQSSESTEQHVVIKYLVIMR